MDEVATRMTTPPSASTLNTTNTTAALSFCYAPCASQQYDLCRKEDEHAKMLSELRDTCQHIMTSTNCEITINNNDKPTKHALVDTPTDYNLTMTGPLNSLAIARSELLLQCPIKVSLFLFYLSF